MSKLARMLIVVTSPVWAIMATVLVITVYLLMIAVWLIGHPIAKAVRYVRFGDTKTEFFDQLEEVINLNFG